MGKNDAEFPRRTAVIIKPGQVQEMSFTDYIPSGGGGSPGLPGGHYMISLDINVKDAPECVPGVKSWTGKLSSNMIEYDVTR